MIISAILLAAGQSKRFGTNKLLLPIKKDNHKNLPIILQAIQSILDAGLNQLIVVIGYQASRIQNLIQSYQISQKKNSKDIPIDIVRNPRYRYGISSSIQTGLSRISKSTDAVLIFLADKPLIHPRTITRIIKRAERTDKAIIIPIYQKQRGHPVCFKKKVFKQLRALNGEKDIGAINIIHNHPDEISYLQVRDKGIILDIDTWEDYFRLLGL